MDDLDDVLGDLLGTDDDPPASSYKPSAGGGRAGARGGRGKPVGKKNEEDFYSSLQAEAEMSDVSDADPEEMAKSLAGLDDMDDALFGGANKPKSPGSGVKSPTPAKSPAGGRSTAAKPKKSSLDFDEDDPLAGLLSDDEDDKPKKSGAKSSMKKQASLDEDDPVSTASSRRLEIDRPPTRSGKELEDAVVAAAKRSAAGGGRRRGGDDIIFDDDDVLGGMGLDSPRGSAKKKAACSDDHREGGAKSIMDDLLGTGSVSKHLERPGTGERRELSFEKKLSGGGGRKKEPEPSEDDFLFGGYKPSSAGGSRPSSKRSVRFEDEDDFFGTKPSSAPAGRRRGAGSLMEDLVSKDDRDWLDIASGSPAAAKKKEKEEERPKSAGNVLDKPTTKPGTAGSTHSEPVDWLGLARLGSPDTTPRDKDEEDASPPAALASKPAEKTPAKQDDYLGLLDEPKSKPKPAPKAEEPDDKGEDDWLKRLQAKKEQRRKTLDEEAPPKPVASGGADDWLGLKDDGPGDDWLGKGSSDSAGDFLGLGKEVDVDSILSKSSQPGSRSADDLFSTPPKREANLPFMKSGDNASSRRDRSPASKGGSQPSSKPSLADSPRGLNATLDALVQMEQKPAAGQPTSTPSVAATLPTGFSPSAIDTGFHQQAAAVAAAELKQKEEMFRQQQQLLAEQQKQEQMNREQQLAQQQSYQLQLQQQLQAQQEQMRKQQEQQILAMQQKHQQMMQSSLATNLTPPSIGLGGMGMMSGIGMMGDLESMMSRLQTEKLHLQNMIETLKSQHQEEIKVMEDSFKKRVDLIEESFGKRESRLKEENELLTSQSMNQLRMVEQEKAELISSQIKKQDQWEKEKEREMDRLKELHRNNISSLRQEHEDSVARLRRAKDSEIEAIINSHEHARHLKSVIDKVDESARDLGGLHMRVESHHSAVLDQREMAAQAKDKELAGLQERLKRQSAETEREKAQLQGLIAKLEMQLTEQTREVEEEKWKARQEESRLKSAQTSLEQERMLMMEQVQREKMELEKMKNQLLQDQKTTLAQLSEERRQLAEEKAQFTISQKLKQEQEMRDSTHRLRSVAEVDSTIRALNDEKARLERIAKDLELDKQKLLSEKDQVEQQKQLMNVEKQKLEQLALQVRQRSQDIEDVCTTAAKAQEEGSHALSLAKNAEFEQQQRLAKINRDLAALREKERIIAQERLSLAREKQDLEKSRSSMLCVNCRTPVKDGATPNNAVPNNNGAYQPRLTQAAQVLMNNLGPDFKLNNLDNISQAIETDRSVRKWKIAADKDKRFLQEESMFLEAIKHAPYNSQGLNKS